MARPSLDTDLGRLGRLLSERQLLAATKLSEELRRLAPGDARVWKSAAQVAISSKDLGAAAQFFAEAARLAPTDAITMLQYGQCLLQLGRRDEARAVALRADGLGIPTSALHDALGSLLTHVEEAEKALPHFVRAVAGERDNIDFRYNLAMAQRMAGDLQAAEESLDAVLAARPLDAEAHHARSGLRTQSSARNHVVELEQVLQQLAGRRTLLPVAFALAKELEDLGQNARSFAHLHAACRSYRTALRYDVADDVAVLDALRSVHSREALGRVRSHVDNEQCIFIVGLPRSGTTLVERILASHSEVFAGGESETFPRLAVEAVAKHAGSRPNKLQFVEQSLTADFEHLGSDYIAAMLPRVGNARKFTDKLPFNYLYAGLISAALPRARFIALRRHPLDSCYAMYKTLFASAYPFSYDLGDLGRYYVAWERLMRHWEQVIGDAWLWVSYEELVASQEEVSRQMIAHCGLVWEPQCLEFHRRRSAVTTASAAQVRQALYSESVGKWRAYAAELAPLAHYLESSGVQVN